VSEISNALPDTTCIEGARRATRERGTGSHGAAKGRKGDDERVFEVETTGSGRGAHEVSAATFVLDGGELTVTDVSGSPVAGSFDVTGFQAAPEGLEFNTIRIKGTFRTGVVVD
jgi:hypothetical protein